MLIGLCGISMAASSPTLDEYRWKNRILVIPNANEFLLAKLKYREKGLAERDVIIIMLQEEGQEDIAKQIRKKFQISASDMNVLLIGKDGRTRVLWKIDDFTTEKLFETIDAMPMRMREINQEAAGGP